jgi:outer membrane lipoprotein-sorting protein
MRIVWSAALVGAVIACGGHLGAAEHDAADIMRKNFMVGKVSDSRGELSMTLVSENGTRRVRTTATLSKLLPNGIDQKRLIRFLSPADVKGTGTLLIEHSDGDDDIWIYLPALHKVRRLVASNKKDSFVGTDFSYGDIIGHKVEDWTYQYVGEETLDGVPTHVIECSPRTDDVKTNSGYGKRKVWVRQDNFVAVKGEFADTAGAPLKEFVARDVREIDPANHKWQAFHLEMKNKQTNHSTEIDVSKLEVGVGASDEQFTERNLEKDS